MTVKVFSNRKAKAFYGKQNPISVKHHVRSGDVVKVIAGDHKGLITRIKKNLGVFVYLKDVFKVKEEEREDHEGNKKIIKRHIYRKVHASNVMLYDTEAGVASKTKKIFEDGKKFVTYAKTGNRIPLKNKSSSAKHSEAKEGAKKEDDVKADKKAK